MNFSEYDGIRISQQNWSQNDDRTSLIKFLNFSRNGLGKDAKFDMFVLFWRRPKFSAGRCRTHISRLIVRKLIFFLVVIKTKFQWYLNCHPSLATTNSNFMGPFRKKFHKRTYISICSIILRPYSLWNSLKHTHQINRDPVLYNAVPNNNVVPFVQIGNLLGLLIIIVWFSNGEVKKFTSSQTIK